MSKGLNRDRLHRIKSYRSTDNENRKESNDVASRKLVKQDGLSSFIEAMVEEIVLEEEPFDSYKEELKKRCEEESVNYDDLEYDLEDFLENLNMGIKSSDGLAVAMAMAFAFEDADKCYVREEKIEEITYIWNERHPNHVFHPHNPIDMNNKEIL